MGWSRQERIETHDRLVAMLDDVRKEIMANYPEVVSVDVGLKEVKGKPVKEFCFRIYVKEKKTPDQLKPKEIIPDEIRGVPTDVIVHTEFFLEDDEGEYSPIWGGVQIQAQGVAGVGTLGCMVTLNADGKVYVLSNHHVLVGATGAIGKLVGQPTSPSVCCCCACGEVATITNALNNALVDCAIARIMGQNAGDDKETRFTHKILQIGPVFGSAATIPGDILRKRGRTTEFTIGTVTTITHSPTVGGVARTNQIRVSPNAPHPRFSAPGDSGSAYVNNLNQVVGLHFAGDGTNGIGNIIANVLAAMAISVPSVGTAGSIPLSESYAEAIPAAHPMTFLSKMEKKLQTNERGQELLQVIRENRHEVLDLINDNREVKVAWNRFQGPSFVGHLMKNAREPEHKIPREINGYSFHNLLIKMSDVLERNGSRQLARAVEDYALVAFNFAEAYTGIDSLDNLLEQYDFCPDCGTLKKTDNYA